MYLRDVVVDAVVQRNGDDLVQTGLVQADGGSCQHVQGVLHLDAVGISGLRVDPDREVHVRVVRVPDVAGQVRGAVAGARSLVRQDVQPADAAALRPAKRDDHFVGGDRVRDDRVGPARTPLLVVGAVATGQRRREGDWNEAAVLGRRADPRRRARHGGRTGAGCQACESGNAREERPKGHRTFGLNAKCSGRRRDGTEASDDDLGIEPIAFDVRVVGDDGSGVNSVRGRRRHNRALHVGISARQRLARQTERQVLHEQDGARIRRCVHCVLVPALVREGKASVHHEPDHDE